MQVNITARHCNVSDRVRNEAAERVQRLQRYEPRARDAVIEFDNDHGHKQVAARLFLAGSHSIIATGSGESFKTALDKSLDRLTSQVKRRRERVRDHKGVRLGQAIDSRRSKLRENPDD